MEPWYIAMLKKLPLNRQTATALLPLVSRYGAKGAVVMARSYLGPVACDVERRVKEGRDPCGNQQDPRTEPPKLALHDAAAEQPKSNTTSTKTERLSEVDIAILGMAVTKLLYEAGELALHNPSASGEGKQPEFKLDERGAAPALSLSHVVAATKLWRAYTAERAEKKEAEQAKELAQAEAEARTQAAPRMRLRTARGQLYAGAQRYSYVPTTTRRS
jgi:uncharacterized sporulation protein YeaH/YhbH (DUF444 family)